MPIKHASDYNPEGLVIGQSATDKVGFFGTTPVMQRSNPMQSIVQGQYIGEIKIHSMLTTAAATNADTCAEQTFTVNGVNVGDFVLAVNFLTQVNAVGMAGWRVTAANTIGLNLCNPTAGALTHAAEVLSYVVARGLTPISVALTPAAVPADSTMEQLFNIGGTGATAVSVLEGDKVKFINVTAPGTGYYNPPTVKIAASPSTTPSVLTGTFAGLPIPQPPVGSGASAVAIIDPTGIVVGVQVTEGGSGYTTPPIITFEGGNNISPGMFLMGSKPLNQAGLGIGNWRVVDDRTIAIEFVNLTANPILPIGAQVYTIAAFNEMPAINNIVMYGLNIVASTACGATTSQNWAMTLLGLDINDALIAAVKPTLQPGLFILPTGMPDATHIGIHVLNLSTGALTPTANEVFTCAIWRRNPPAVGNLFVQQIVPTACAPITITEQTFTVPGVPFITPVPSSVWVNKPSYTAGIAIVGVRVTAANTVRISFMNTSAVAITPPTESYIFYSFPNLPQGLTTSWTSTAASLTFNQLIDLANEMQTSKVITGFMKGS